MGFFAKRLGFEPGDSRSSSSSRPVAPARMTFASSCPA